METVKQEEVSIQNLKEAACKMLNMQQILKYREMKLIRTKRLKL